jgi:hypothetical protein
MGKKDQLDFFGDEPPDDGGLNGPWCDRAMIVLRRHQQSGIRITTDDLRNLVERKVGPPHESNQWGDLFRRARKQGLLSPTGDRVPSMIESNHGREVHIYRWG